MSKYPDIDDSSYFIGEGFQDGGFTGVVEAEHQDLEFVLLILSEISENVNEASTLSCRILHLKKIITSDETRIRESL